MSALATTTTSHDREHWPFIVAYCRMMGSYDYYVADEIARAIVRKLPRDTYAVGSYSEMFEPHSLARLHRDPDAHGRTFLTRRIIEKAEAIFPDNHLWCLRSDLLRRANRLIAEHFEEALGASPDAAGARKYHRPKPHQQAVVDFYPTPPAVVARMIHAADLERGMEVLEPSAGEGAIVRGILEAGCAPDAFEIDPDRAEILRDMLPPGAVACMDFLRIPPEPEYDRVLMNPPFGKGAGVQHVLHGLRFLKPGGKLVAVLGAGLEYRDDGPTRELRELMFAWGGHATTLPAGSFRDAGTDVETLLVVIPKPSSPAPALPAPEDHPPALETTAP